MIIVVVALIPAILIVGGLYVFGKMKMHGAIQEAVDNMNDLYYKNLASVCLREGASEYKCCLASVYDMYEIGAKLATDDSCAGMVKDRLRCHGSFEWCVPYSNVTSPDSKE